MQQALSPSNNVKISKIKIGFARREHWKNLLRNPSLLLKSPDHNGTESSEEKIFCISIQRTGTTSVGKFFRDFGFKWAGWEASRKNGWGLSWYDGDYEKIFSSFFFRAANAFEDSPWFMPGFYKVLYHRFPNVKFILFKRDPDAWFQSILNHPRINILEGSRVHCKIYRRELEYFDFMGSWEIDKKFENQNFPNNNIKELDFADHYKDVYRLHNIEVEDFFQRHAPDSLFKGELEDPCKWQKLGEFLNIDVPKEYSSHENPSGGE